MYRDDDNIKHFVGMLDGIAFLPPHLVEAGLEQVKQFMPNNLFQPLIDYMEKTYVLGTLRRINNNNVMRIVLRRTPPLFPIDIWNVHAATIRGEERTNNPCEGWNSSFKKLLNQNQPSIWKLITNIQMDEVMASNDIIMHGRGILPPKKESKAAKQHQNRLHEVLTKFNNQEHTLVETLNILGHCIRL